jgi:selenocysteine-specific translation elongation factor
VRLHVGTAELMASVIILEGDEIAPGDAALVQFLLAEPAATVWGQAVVIRSESPVATIGGGTVLDPDAPKLARDDPAARDFLSAFVRMIRSRERRRSLVCRVAKWSSSRCRGRQESTKSNVSACAGGRGELLELPVSSTRLLASSRGLRRSI